MKRPSPTTPTAVSPASLSAPAFINAVFPVANPFVKSLAPIFAVFFATLKLSTRKEGKAPTTGRPLVAFKALGILE